MRHVLMIVMALWMALNTLSEYQLGRAYGELAGVVMQQQSDIQQMQREKAKHLIFQEKPNNKFETPEVGREQ